MRTIKITIVISLAFLGIALLYTPDCYASPDKAVFMSRLVWRGDGAGDYTFEKEGKFKGTGIAEDGSVEYTQSPGVYELTTPYVTEGSIYSVSANWSFTGKVTMEVSAAGNSSDYVAVINGVPLEYGKFASGKKLIWRATLAPDSKLTEVNITYTDLSGVLGSFGTPQLSGFMFRKPVYITGSAQGDLFHYQISIRVGESSKASDYDVSLKGVIQSDFADLRFTQADQETLLPYYLEEITGNAPDRTAIFWVKIPHIPPEGLLVYLYYGNADAEDLSDAEEVFDFFDDFQGTALDDQKWISVLDAELSRIEVSDSRLRLDAAKVISAVYELEDGVIEYKAESNGGAVISIIRGGSSEEQNRVYYSSTAKNAEHSIAVGTSVKVNDPKPISLTPFYNYRITANAKDLTFQRYNNDWSELEAEVEYQDVSSNSGYIGLSTTSEGLGAYYDWIRVRQLAIPTPQVDISKTALAQEEVPNIPDFQGAAVAPNGDLIIYSQESEGEYISQLIHSPFKIRIIVPGWTAQYASRTTRDGDITIDISAKEYGLFKQESRNGAYYYTSRKDFTEGDKLRWRARLSRKDIFSDTPRLKRVYMDFMPGAINVILPNGGENLVKGSQYSLAWDAANYESSYDMKLEYSTDGGRKFQVITGEADNSGRYLWTVPNELSDKVVIKVSDALDESIYDVSNDYLSIVLTAPEEEEEQGTGDRVQGTEEELIPEPRTLTPEEELAEGQRSGTKLYDLLIKVGDRRSPDAAEDLRASYKDGDIVMIKPAGHKWGAAELNKFVVIQAYLTPAEARDLMSPRKAADGTMLRRRKHKVDLRKQGIPVAVSAMRRLLQSKPLVDIETIEEK